MELKELDAVVIASPNYLHYPMAMKALQHNLNILCEKPLATNLDDAKEMHKKAEKKSIKHMISFTFRFASPFQKAKDLLEKNILGELFHFNAHFLADFDANGFISWRFIKSKAGYGALADLAPHLTDIGRWFMGDIKRVCGISNTFVKNRKLEGKRIYREVDVDDSIAFIAEFENGVQGIFQASMVATGRDGLMRIEISGRKGSIVLERKNGVISLYKMKKESENFVLVEQCKEERKIIFTHMARCFSDYILHNKQLVPTFYDGVKTQEIIEAVDQSVKQNRWISLPV